MPNLHQALSGSPAAPDMQLPTPVAPPAGGPAAGSPQDGLSLFKALHPNIDPGMAETIYNVAVKKGGHNYADAQGPVNPYTNYANKATGQGPVR